MKKNDKSLISGLSIEQIEEQKMNLQKELESTEKMKNQLVIKSYALSGAIQQCDIFINMFDASPANSIPSEDDNAALNAAFS
tara:strand:- start:621 stop:866 length:246 start_codon:yes stop_codon:yes gene_type:complete